MKIYINTSDEVVEIGGETFIPGEWLHLDDSFKVSAMKYPFIKSPQVILTEKYADIQATAKTSKEQLISLKEQHLEQFALGIKQAEDMYKMVVEVNAY